jgi:GT2 family glycosyltransferase
VDASTPADEAPTEVVAAPRIEVAAPRVEIVIVAHEPGDWFEEALSAAAVQDYPRLDVTVLTTGGDEELRAMVEDGPVEAELREVDPSWGFGRSVNSVLESASRPAFYLFCHDDVALAPDATRLLVEESLRSNASVVGPKIVAWERPSELTEVGLDVDKLGHVASRVEPGEIDQEQHDAVADVFAVSAAALMVRADLFEALGGFDKAMGITGEDIDLCWRAHVAGARVMVVPSAVARHRGGLAERREAPEVERLTERHRLRSVLSNYGLWHSLRVVPQAVLVSVVRAFGALLTGHFGRSRALVGAWGWNLARPGSLLGRRRALRRVRQLPDGEIRRLQIGGFAPLTAFLRGQLSPGHAAGSATARLRGLLDNLRAGPSRVSMSLWVGLTVVFAFGSRHLLTRGVPAVGDLAPFDLGVRDHFETFFDSWWRTGFGHEGAAPTAHAIVGALGFVFMGSMGLLRTVLTVGMIPIGALGMWRLLRPFESPWVRSTGTAMYVATPIPYNSLVHGSWSGLILFGAMPWLLSVLGRAGRLAPFGRVGGAAGPGVYQPSWPREALGLGLVSGAVVAFVPLAAALVVAIAVLLVMGSLFAGWPTGVARLAGVTLVGLIIAVALNGPWLLDVLVDEPSWSWLAGTRPEGVTDVDLVDALTLHSGEVGGEPLGWAMTAAAVVPLVLARGDRWAWAVRGWTIYLASAAGAWMVGEPWFDWSAPRPEVIMAPGALGLALAVAMGAGAIHRDLRTYHFGWRQLVPLTAVAAIALAVVPVLGASFSGYWRMPDEELDLRLGQSEASSPAEGRVLWLGHDDLLGPAGQSLEPGLTVAVTSGLTGTFVDRWGGVAERADGLLIEALTLAIDGRTSRLGRLLAPMGIGDVVTIERLAPLPAESQIEPIPAAISRALAEQLDLDEIKVAPGITRYRNTSALGVVAVVDRGSTSGRTVGDFVSAVEAVSPIAVLDQVDRRARFEGEIVADTADREVFAAVAGGSEWRLIVDDRVASRGPGLEWAVTFQPSSEGFGVLEHRTSDSHRMVMGFQVALWLVGLVALVRLSTEARGLEP